MTQTSSPWRKNPAKGNGGRKTGQSNGPVPQPVVPMNPGLKSDTTLLVVNHQPMLRKATAALLRRLGYHVLEAAGTVQAQRIATRRKRIDLLFVDFSLPGGNGLELVHWFQSMFPKTRALVAADSLWELLYQGGRQEQYIALAKPFSDVELDDMVRRTLA